MERFTKTKFFLSLKESKNIRSSSLDDEYNEFVGLLFAGNAGMGKVEYHNALFYTGMELASLTEVSGKKTRRHLQKAIGIVDRQMEFVRWQMQTETTAQSCLFSRQSPKHGKLKWTDSVVEWVELIYALYSVKRISNGKITLKELFGQMDEIF
jgi:hypothetical protein